MSPHPDDDVISMGGTLLRLAQQGHEVHVAYQTSGSIAVRDEDLLARADFAGSFAETVFQGHSGSGGGSRAGIPTGDEPGGSAATSSLRPAAHGDTTNGGCAASTCSAAGGEAGKAEPRAETSSAAAAAAAARIRRLVADREPGSVDAPEVERAKALLRRCEARAAAAAAGVPAYRLHFLESPFYQTGRVVKAEVGPADVALVADLLEAVRPHLVFAAGDLSDPHGTHRACLKAVYAALEQACARPWYRACGTDVLLYRGAWQEWAPHEADLIVPLSPGELRQKLKAIWAHQSQKDPPLFPGPDEREFWVRARERNRATAAALAALGLPRYEAAEAFARYAPSRP